MFTHLLTVLWIIIKDITSSLCGLSRINLIFGLFLAWPGLVVCPQFFFSLKMHSKSTEGLVFFFLLVWLLLACESCLEVLPFLPTLAHCPCPLLIIILPIHLAVFASFLFLVLLGQHEL